MISCSLEKRNDSPEKPIDFKYHGKENIICPFVLKFGSLDRVIHTSALSGLIRRQVAQASSFRQGHHEARSNLKRQFQHDDSPPT